MDGRRARSRSSRRWRCRRLRSARRSREAQATPLKVALVTDIGGLNDKGFNQLANKGLSAPKKQLGVKTRVFISKSAARLHPEPLVGGAPGLRPRHRRRLPHGRRDGGRREAVPEHEVRDHRHPVRPSLQGRSRRTSRGSCSREQEAGYLVGVAAATDGEEAAARSASVGGIKIPPVDRYIAGYQAGARRRSPGIKIAQRLLAGLRRPGEVQGVALDQIAQGSKVVFQVAGGCGLGAIEAAEGEALGHRRRRRPGYLGAARADERAEEGRRRRLRRRSSRSKSGKFKGGRDSVFSVANGGVGFGKVSSKAPNRAALIAEAQQRSRSRSRRARSRHPAHRRLGSSDAIRTTPRGRAFEPALPRLVVRTRRLRPPCAIESRAMAERPRPRAARHHEALPGHRRERRRRLRPPPRRGARAPRRERRRQVDADEHPLRAVPAGRGRDPDQRASRSSSARRSEAIDAGIGMVHQHFMLIPVMTVAENIVLAAEPTDAGVLLDYDARRASACASCPSASGSRSTRGRAIEDITVGQQQRVEILKALYRDADILILDEPTAVLTPQEARRAVRDHAQPDARGQVDHLHHPQAERGARDRRPHHRAAARQARSRRCRARARPRRASRG